MNYSYFYRATYGCKIKGTRNTTTGILTHDKKLDGFVNWLLLFAPLRDPQDVEFFAIVEDLRFLHDDSEYKEPISQIVPTQIVSTKVSKCPNKINGSCELHNLFCNYPECEK